MADFPAIPAGFGIPLVDMDTYLFPEPTMEALGNTLVPLENINAVAPASSYFWQFPAAVMASVQINTGTGRHVTALAPNGKVYAAWWDAQAQATVGQWDSPTRTWATVNLSRVPGNPMRSPAPVDEHNSLSIAVDGDGFIHLWGNHHNNKLQYARSASANDISAWVIPGMIGTEETQVTYPEAIRLSNGNLLMTYRSGVSGNGDQYLNLYTKSTSTWSRVAQVFKGTTPVSPDESAYPASIVVDGTGVLHWFFDWRTDDTLASSHNLGYIKSADNGVTWTTAAGGALTLPIQPSITTTAVPIGATPGVYAGGDASVDSNNVPHMVKWAGVPGARELHHYWYSGGAWHDDLILTNVVGGTNPKAWSYGTSTWAIYSADGRVVSIRLAPTVGTEVDLVALPVHQWEGSTDSSYTAGYRTFLGPSASALISGSWGGVLTLTPDALNGVAADIKARPNIVAPAARVAPSTAPLTAGFYYGPPTGARGNTTTQLATAGNTSGAVYFAGQSAHAASLAIRLVTGGSADSSYRLLLVEVLTPTTGIVRAASASASGQTTGNIEISVENNVMPANLLAGRQYVLAVQYLGGTTGPFMTSIPGSAWNEPNLGQVTLSGALVPNVSYAGFSVTAVGGGTLSTTVAIGDAVGLGPTGTVPLVVFKVTAQP